MSAPIRVTQKPEICSLRFVAKNLTAMNSSMKSRPKGVAAVVVEKEKFPRRLLDCAVLAVDEMRASGIRKTGGGVSEKDFDLPVVCVGGSNGKTTVKELIASVLRQKFSTLWSEARASTTIIGVPTTLLRLEKSHQVAVLEAGTNHPGELAPLMKMIQPKLGVLTNIGREHLGNFW